MTECVDVGFTEEPNGKVKCHLMKDITSEKKSTPPKTKAIVEDVITIRPNSDEKEKEKACSKNNGGCSHHCVETPESFHCRCKPGYTLHCEGKLCLDIDECLKNTHDCDANALCDNIGGSFNCTCKAGWQGDGKTCEDIDECTTNKHDCDANANCANTLGLFNCTCNSGWRGDGKHCEDIDECTTNKHDCDAKANCANTPGLFNCTCNSGWRGDGKHCEDIDECTTNEHDCDTNANCANTVGLFDCSCNSGWKGDGKHCEDIDECTTNKHDCDVNAKCSNRDGSFDCTCNSGYRGNGKVCQDVDECTENSHTCDGSTQECKNTIGAFNCIGVSCKTLKKRGQTSSGYYWTDLSGAQSKMYCDMATDGGGWLQVGRTTQTTVVYSSDLTHLHNVENNNFMLNKDGLKKLYKLMPFTEIRWYCNTPSDGSKVHIKTLDNDLGRKVRDYMLDISSVAPITCGSFKRLSGDNSFFGSNCDKVTTWTSNIIYNSPFYHSGHDFDIGNGGWECSNTGTREGQWAFYVR